MLPIPAIIHVASRALMHLAAAHLKEHGAKSVTYWLKLAVGILTAAGVLGLYYDLVSFLTKGTAMTENPLIGTMLCLFFGVLALPILGFVTLLSHVLTRRFPGWFDNRF